MSTDSQAIALACSVIAGTPRDSAKPLTAREWDEVRRALSAAGQAPSDLFGRDVAGIAALGIDGALAERLGRLLARGGQLAVEVERLQARGIWIVTRADEAYPRRLKQRLNGQAPPVLFGAGLVDRIQERGLAVVGARDVGPDGLEFAEALGRRCAAEGTAVVSGAARGVDAAAMGGALDAGGAAVGITVDPLERLVRRRELRHPLMEGQLTLATPFHPSARWHAGNAMARNRLIYALADAAVVVASSPDGGGTRTGALENLKARWVPLFVRADGSLGNELLLRDGARPLPADDLASLDLKGLFEREPAPRAAPAEKPAASPAPEVGRAEPEADDIFDVVWPQLAAFLHEPRSAEDVASHFELVLTQARAWLTRAEDEGRVTVRKRPKRWVVAGPQQQDHLFDAAI